MNPFRHPARGYDLTNVEQGDLLTIGFKGGTIFNAVATAEPSDFYVEAIDAAGVRLEIPATLVLSHLPRGHWHQSRTELAA